MNIDEKVKRYGLTKFSKDGFVTAHDMAEWPTGDYVKYSDYSALIAMVRQLEADKVGLVEALKLYAAPNNWENDFVDIGIGNQSIPDSSYAVSDCGMTARDALAKHGGQP